MSPPRTQIFPADEYSQRLRCVRERMTGAGLDVLLVHAPENIYYLTGYQTPGYYWHQVLVLPLGSDPIFVPPPHEASLVPEFCWVDDVRLYPDTSDWAVVTSDLLKELGFGSATIGVEAESQYLSVDLRDRLAGRIPGATIRNGSGLIEPCRLIKSPREQEYLRQAARFSEQGMQAGIAAVREGASELEVAAAVHTALDLAGSEYTGLPAFITSGDRSELVHATWSPRTIGPGELVFLEIPGSLNRYHAAHTRSVFVGDPAEIPETVERAGMVAKDALETAKGKMRPGVPARDVFEAGRAVIDGADIGYRQGRRIAYGIGIAFPPGWDEGDIISINSDEPRGLQAGMCFHLITTMRLKGMGAIGSSDTVLVNDDGVETLTGAVPLGIQRT
ncbi:MAG: Xaa-Pro peptidase family protein [Dehalococcoidia bacterium]|nr:Xaa-Pro peptidase family protein [Dehalococcoidia bacterium]